MAILRRRLRCHYCNTQARDTVSPTTRTYHCTVCDADNYFDERGNITDPPVEAISAPPRASVRYGLSRSPSPAMQPADETLFCSTCLRNQAMMRNILAEYLPDEDDPDYAKHEVAYEDYKLEVEQRYPQLCDQCEPRVQAQIANAGYAAKADHLRRIMEKSQQRRAIVQTPRQVWLLRLVALGKWTYIASMLAGLIWHALALIMAPDDEYTVQNGFRWNVCARQAVFVFSVDESCVLSNLVLRFQLYAIIADFLTLWWNPKLEFKTYSLTGRMIGLKPLWIVRMTVLLLRFGNLYYWRWTDVSRETLKDFRTIHTIMLIVLVLSYLISRKAVRIVYLSSSSTRHHTKDNISNTPTSAEKRLGNSYRSAHPQANTFDNMAQAFTTSFQDGLAIPPSPTLTASSRSTQKTEATTPYTLRSTRLAEDDMDWTPTQQRRFASHEPEILPNPWATRHAPPPPSSPPRRPEPHSLFSRPDPNPFRHKVPAAPKAPAQLKADPWRPGVWNPPNKETTPDFFRKARSDVGEDKGLDGFGVPRNVKRDAELFASPKLKYDNYGPVKDTGLEDMLNGLFSK